MTASRHNRSQLFFGWRVVAAAFVLAMFGWGFGFYGPPVYLYAVREARGFSLMLVSAAVTLHYLSGALVAANLARLYRAFGTPTVTKASALSLALGVTGWAAAAEPWQLLVATLFSGAGWVGLSAAGINAILAPWFVRRRPAALAMAYNGASVGGIVFQPLWVVAIEALGFVNAAVLIGIVMVLVVWVLADRFVAQSPEAMGVAPDGDAPGAPVAAVTVSTARPLPGRALYASPAFITLAGGMALGLFAQVGLLSHLLSALVPALGPTTAGLLMGAATAAAIVSRTLFGWLMRPGADRRRAAVLSYAIQIAGCGLLIASGGKDFGLIVAGTLLIGSGIGNATSLPPMIAQVEFVTEDTARVVGLIVAISQAGYAFAPAVFGVFRELFASDAALYSAAALVQALAMGCFIVGRQRGSKSV